MRTHAGPWRHIAAVGLVMGAVLGAATPAAVGEAAAQPAPAPPVAVTDLPAGIDFFDIDNRGRALGVTLASTPERRAVVWDDGETTDIGPYEAPPNPYCPTGCMFPIGPPGPRINDRGQVGTYRDGHGVLWQGGRVTSLGGDADSSWLLDLNERGEALVLRFAEGQQVVGLWRRGSFTELESGPLAMTFGHLSDRGHALVTVLDPRCTCVEGFVWHRGVRHDLPAGLGAQAVNRRGQVVGLARDPATEELYPYVWQDRELTRLPTLGSHQVSVDGINDRGQIAGYIAVPGTSQLRTVLWEGGEIAYIGPDTEDQDNPVGINARGDVLIEEHRIFDRTASYLWRDGELIPLPPSDDPEVSAQVRDLNDRGQIVGRRASRNGVFVPTLWEVQDS